MRNNPEIFRRPPIIFVSAFSTHVRRRDGRVPPARLHPVAPDRDDAASFHERQPIEGDGSSAGPSYGQAHWCPRCRHAAQMDAAVPAGAAGFPLM